jgi:hypothetical protein
MKRHFPGLHAGAVHADDILEGTRVLDRGVQLASPDKTVS